MECSHVPPQPPPSPPYGGYNYDIMTGVLALPVGLALASGRATRNLVVLFNAVGLLLLSIIVVVAVLATPLVRAFGDSQLNVWITQFPYAWMSVMVSSALLGHVLLFRKLRMTSPARRPLDAATLPA